MYTQRSRDSCEDALFSTVTAYIELLMPCITYAMQESQPHYLNMIFHVSAIVAPEGHVLRVGVM